jgi:serine/threonine-protein kinase RsbW
MDDHNVAGTIELVLPADTRLVRLARLMASGVAGSVGFDVEEIEDLRIAVDEGCAALIESGDGSPLLLSFGLDGDTVEVFGSTAAGEAAIVDTARLSLSNQILDVVADEHELTSDHGRTIFRLRKRRRPERAVAPGNAG